MQSHLSKDVVRNITTAMQLQSELQLAQAQHGVAVLDIYNSEWGHCKALGETFRRLYTDAGDVIYLRFFSVECNAVLESLRNDAAGNQDSNMANYYPGAASHASSSAVPNKKMSMSGRALLKQPPNLSTLHPAAASASAKAAAASTLNRQGVMSYHADTTSEVWSAILESRVKHAKPFFVVYKEGKICGQVEGIDTPRICKVVHNLCTPPEPASNFITNPALLRFWERHFDADESKVSANELLHALMNDSEMQQVTSIADWLHVDNAHNGDINVKDGDNNVNKPISVLRNAIINEQTINHDNNDDESSDNVISARALQNWIGDDSTLVQKLSELITQTQQSHQTPELEQQQPQEQQKEEEEEEEGEYEYEYEEEEEVKPQESQEEQEQPPKMTEKAIITPIYNEESIVHTSQKEKKNDVQEEQQKQEEEVEEEEEEYEYEEVTEEQESEEQRLQTQSEQQQDDDDDVILSPSPDAKQNVNEDMKNRKDNTTITTNDDNNSKSNLQQVNTDTSVDDDKENVPPDTEQDNDHVNQEDNNGNSSAEFVNEVESENENDDDGVNDELRDNTEGKQNVNQVLLEDRWVTVSAEEMRIWDCIASLPLQYPVSTSCAIRIESTTESNSKSAINREYLTEKINAEVVTLQQTLTLLEYLQHESLSKDEVNMMCLAADQKVGSESLSLGKLALVLMSCQSPVTEVLLHNGEANIYSELCSGNLLHLHPSIALTALTLCASATEPDECFYYCPSCDNSETRSLCASCKVNDLIYLPALTPLYCDDPHTDQGGDGQQEPKVNAIDSTIDNEESNNIMSTDAVSVQHRSEMVVTIEGLPKVIELATTDPSVTNTVLLNQWHARLRVMDIHNACINTRFVEYICDQEYEKEVESFSAKLVEEEAQIDRRV